MYVAVQTGQATHPASAVGGHLIIPNSRVDPRLNVACASSIYECASTTVTFRARISEGREDIGASDLALASETRHHPFYGVDVEAARSRLIIGMHDKPCPW